LHFRFQTADRHFDYVHYNPVKHGHATCPGDWQESTFLRWMKAGLYERDWGCAQHGTLSFADLDETAMELGLV
jgi:putative transposase